MTRISCLAASLLLACGPSTVADPQNPPMGDADLFQWLEAGHYKKWSCEPAPHDARAPSPHSKNRVCSNAKLSAAGVGEYPVDSASVKELFDATGTMMIGRDVARHVKAGTTEDTWYWYSRFGATVTADGIAAPRCNGCHSAAGSDADHPGHDYAYTQVK